MMKELAMVKHKDGGGIFHFEIPDSLRGRADCGIEVICDTRYGDQRGRICGFVRLNDESLITNGRKLKKIKGVLIESDPEAVNCRAFEETVPNRRKVWDHFYRYLIEGKLDPVVVDCDMNIVDGYISLLLAKRLNSKVELLIRG